MKKYYTLPAAGETPLRDRDRFMKDKQKRYIKLETESSGSLGYWDKKSVQMYSLSLSAEGTRLVCTLVRQEERRGRLRRPHDMLFSLGVSLGVFVLLYLLLGLALKNALLAGAVGGLVGLVTLLVMLAVYLMEYRGFYRLLDAYLLKTLRATPQGRVRLKRK